MSQSESKDLCIILHFFRFVQIFPEVFRYIQIYSDIFGYFAIFPHILRFIEILLDLSGYIYLCWHKTRAKGNFVQWITLYPPDGCRNYAGLYNSLDYKSDLLLISKRPTSDSFHCPSPQRQSPWACLLMARRALSKMASRLGALMSIWWREIADHRLPQR